MQPTRKGTRVYTRIQSSTGTEIVVRKRKQRFVLFIDNSETSEFPTQESAMEAADRLADDGKTSAKRITFGMLPQLQVITEEDFKSAEWSDKDIETR